LLDLFEPVENSITVLADYIGPHKIMWATDYPHRDGFFPGAPQMFRDRLGRLAPEAKHQVMAGGAMGFYGLQQPRAQHPSLNCCRYRLSSRHRAWLLPWSPPP
jgi:predicted TIM-barrel fold metal-dependent hydrolase